MKNITKSIVCLFTASVLVVHILADATPPASPTPTPTPAPTVPALSLNEQSLQNQLTLLSAAGKNLPAGVQTMTGNLPATPEGTALALEELSKLADNLCVKILASGSITPGEAIVFVNTMPAPATSYQYYNLLKLTTDCIASATSVKDSCTPVVDAYFKLTPGKLTPGDLPNPPVIRNDIILGALPLLISAIPPALSAVTGLFNTDINETAGSPGLLVSTLQAILTSRLEAAGHSVYVSVDSFLSDVAAHPSANNILNTSGIGIVVALSSLNDSAVAINGLNDTVTALIAQWKANIAINNPSPADLSVERDVLRGLINISEPIGLIQARIAAIQASVDVSKNPTVLPALIDEGILLEYAPGKVEMISVNLSTQAAGLTQVHKWWGNKYYFSTTIGAELFFINPIGKIDDSTVIARRRAESMPTDFPTAEFILNPTAKNTVSPFITN